MKLKKTMPLLFLMALSAALAGQEIIENSAKPASKNAGRVLKLKEIWRIEDKGDPFYFKYPRNLKIAADGSVFLADEDQFLRFSSEGKFIKNLYKKGQAPGEFQFEFSYFIYGENLFIQDYISRRLWRTDWDGVFKEEIRLEKKDLRMLLGVTPDGFLFRNIIALYTPEGMGKMTESLNTVTLVSRDGKEEKDIHLFRPKVYLYPNGAREWDSSIISVSADGKLIFGYHGRDYLIEVLDVSRKKIIKRFNRKYEKFPHFEEKWETDFRKRSGAPKMEYESDVENLYVNGPLLWVETSTVDKIKGSLFDVFNADGRFLDSFYLGSGKTLMNVQGDVLYVLEKNEEENYRLVKYKIEER